MSAEGKSRVIADFVETYRDRADTYELYAKSAKEICEEGLKRATIPAVATYRAKELRSAEEKAIKRNKDVNYRNKDKIFDDLPDLAGARIAVYFPDHKKEVDKILNELFEVHHDYEKPGKGKASGDEGAETQSAKDEEYSKRFGPYRGRHYHVSIPLKNRPGKNKLDFKVEIQLVTVSSSVWSQVEHVIVYKQITGKPSKDERRILDLINGLSNLGEGLLEQLFATQQSRIKAENAEFVDEYELGAYLRKWISLKNRDEEERVVNLGPVPGLFAFLQTLNVRTPKALNAALEELDPFKDNIFSYDGYTQADDNNFSLYIVKEVIKKPKQAERIRRAKAEYRRTKLTPERCGKALSIIASTVMWLEEFFPAIEWEKTLLSDIPSIKTKENLGWLLMMEDNRVGVSSIWADGEPPSKSELEKIQGLLTWLLDHEDEAYVQFAFGLSCCGMLKAASSAPRLRSIGSHLTWLTLLP